jgi:hypothetical protein
MTVVMEEVLKGLHYSKVGLPDLETHIARSALFIGHICSKIRFSTTLLQIWPIQAR